MRPVLAACCCGLGCLGTRLKAYKQAYPYPPVKAPYCINLSIPLSSALPALLPRQTGIRPDVSFIGVAAGGLVPLLVYFSVLITNLPR